MALITRISRLFKADFHAVLDRVEEPELLLQQAIREMEDELSEAELRQRRTLVERDGLKARTVELERAVAQIDEELDVCFESGEPELARDLIRRKLQTRRVSRAVSSRLGALDKRLGDWQQALHDNRATLESLRQKAELFHADAGSSGRDRFRQGDLACSPQELPISDNDVEVAFLQERKLRGQS